MVALMLLLVSQRWLMANRGIQIRSFEAHLGRQSLAPTKSQMAHLPKNPRNPDLNTPNRMAGATETCFHNSITIPFYIPLWVINLASTHSAARCCRSFQYLAIMHVEVRVDVSLDWKAFSSRQRRKCTRDWERGSSGIILSSIYQDLVLGEVCTSIRTQKWARREKTWSSLRLNVLLTCDIFLRILDMKNFKCAPHPIWFWCNLWNSQTQFCLLHLSHFSFNLFINCNIDFWSFVIPRYVDSWCLICLLI